MREVATSPRTSERPEVLMIEPESSINIEPKDGPLYLSSFDMELSSSRRVGLHDHGSPASPWYVS